MSDWPGVLIVLGFVTIVLLVYMLITRSAGIYGTPRKFWRVLTLSAAISYLLSGSLFLFLHVNATVCVAVSAIVPFLIGNLDLGESSREPAPTDEGLAGEQTPAEDGEEEVSEDEEQPIVDTEIRLNHVQNDLI